MILSDREKLILDTKLMMMSVDRALQYVNAKEGWINEHNEPVDKNAAHKMLKWRTYYRTLGSIEKDTLQRGYDIAKKSQEYVQNQIEKLEFAEEKKWEDYWVLKSNGQIMNANRILNDIIALQPYLTTYREAIQRVMERNVSTAKNEPTAEERFALFSV